MKKDIDRLMEERGIDYLLMTGAGFHNPAMVYLTGGGHFTRADLIKKRGEPPILFHEDMERDEAMKTGLQTRRLSNYSLKTLLEKTNGNRSLAYALRYQAIFSDLGITSGNVALYGRGEVGSSFAVFSTLQDLMPGIKIIGEMEDSLLFQARATKTDEEVARIRRMGQITVDVVAETANFLTAHSARGEVLVKSDGDPLTIGEVKRHIDLWLAERGAENPEGTIFAIGRDAGVPHSSGNALDSLKLGQTIVFDIFPCETGGGYYYDFTRTWCLGYAPDSVLALYEQVYAVYQQLQSELKPGKLCSGYQQRACELFEKLGHPTISTNPQTTDGYVHSLGHGLGLNVHERPWFNASAGNDERLQAGSVFTLEPGLYYPERGMGVRLEDTLWMRPDGRGEVLADYPMELVLPIKK